MARLLLGRGRGLDRPDPRGMRFDLLQPFRSDKGEIRDSVLAPSLIERFESRKLRIPCGNNHLAADPIGNGMGLVKCDERLNPWQSFALREPGR